MEELRRGNAKMRKKNDKKGKRERESSTRGEGKGK